MEQFYELHGLDQQTVECEIEKKRVFDEIMNKFEEGTLMCRGKGGTERVVTNSKQAYAIACSMSERAVRRKIIDKTQPPLRFPCLNQA